MMAKAEPASASTFMNRAKSSSTKLPPKLVSRPCGSNATIIATSTSSAMATQFTIEAARSPRKTPNISSAIAPTASTISGSTGSIAGTA